MYHITSYYWSCDRTVYPVIYTIGSNTLIHRSQQTRVGNSLSDVTYLSSGVVQGSVIGPLLFVLFINDIANLFNDSKCVCKLYADDLKLYSTLETDADISYLQKKTHWYPQMVRSMATGNIVF